MFNCSTSNWCYCNDIMRVTGYCLRFHCFFYKKLVSLEGNSLKCEVLILFLFFAGVMCSKIFCWRKEVSKRELGGCDCEWVSMGQIFYGVQLFTVIFL
jgi:hypothetical protein